MHIEDADFSHLYGQQPYPAPVPSEVTDSVAPSPEANEAPFPYFEKDVTDFSQAAQLILAKELSEPIGQGLVSYSNISKNPFSRYHSIPIMLKELGVRVGITDDAVMRDGSPYPDGLTVSIHPDDCQLVSDVHRGFRAPRFLDSFISKVSNSTIYPFALDANHPTHSIVLDTIYYNSAENSTKLEQPDARVAFMIRGFLSSAVLRQLDLGQTDGLKANNHLSSQDIKDIHLYDQLRSAGNEPFRAEEILGMQEGEFRAVLAANPELAVRLEERRQQAAASPKPKTPTKPLEDYGLDF